MAFLLWLNPTHAGQFQDQCKQAAQEGQQQAQSAVDQAKANDASNAAAGKAASGTNINNNSGIQSGAIAAQNSNLQNAINQTKAAKAQCDQKCDQAKQQAQQDLQQAQAQRDTGRAQMDQQDLQQIPQTKQSQCDAPIDAMTKQLQSGQQPLPGQQQEANNTGGDSKGNGAGGGMPSMSPPSSPSPSPQPSPDSTQTSGNTQVNLPNSPASPSNCVGDAASSFSDCNSQFVANCTSNPQAAGCASFTSRYCTPTSTSQAVESKNFMSRAPSTNLVVNRSGEGVGTSYCQSANTSQFCQNPANAKCPSCSGAANGTMTPTDLNQAKQDCPSDPMFINPANTASTTATNKPAGVAAQATPGGGSGSGGSSRTGGADSGAGSDKTRAVGEGLLSGMALDSGGAGGGGGGFSYGGGSNYERAPSSLYPRAGGDKAKASVNALVGGVPLRDVANAAGPSLFTLSSIAYQAYCTRVQVKNCH